MAKKTIRSEAAETDRRLNRRQFGKLVATGGAVAAGIGTTSCATQDPAADQKQRRSLTLAHLTDIHVWPRGGSEEAMAACLHHVQSHPQRPELILNGGDAIMDCNNHDESFSRVQWELWQKVLKNECSLPVLSCIGNHDIWGTNYSISKTTGDEPLHGKQWALKVLKMDARYYSFERAGWHFIVLDSYQTVGEPGSGQLTARLDEEQFAWLAADLAAVPRETPVLVLSHAPILSACAFYFSFFPPPHHEKTGSWILHGGTLHIDSRRIKDLFYNHPNVRLCLSGHIHLKDRVDYNGVTYLCNGAVSGNWWRGISQETPEGYGLVTLYEDGSFDHEYVAYGWKARE